MRSIALTTVDNPFDPISDFSNWFYQDTKVLGYHTLSYLGRVSRTSDALSDEDYDMFVESAMDEIVKENPNFYKKIVKEE